MFKNFAALFFLVLFAKADIIPAERLYPWSTNTTGSKFDPAGRPLNAWTNLSQTGIDLTGNVDARDVLTSIVNNCPTNRDIVLDVPGKIKLSTPIGWNGVNQGWQMVSTVGTNIGFEPVDQFLFVDANTFFIVATLHTNMLRLTNQLVTDGVSMVDHIGKRIMIRRSQYGATDFKTIDIFATDYIMSWIAQITNVVNGTNVFFDPPIPFAVPLETRATISYNSSEAGNIAFKGFTINGGDSSAFNLFGPYNIVLDNLFIIQGSDYLINSANGFRYTVRHCFTTSTNSGSGSAVMLFANDNSHRVENHYNKNGSPTIEVNATKGCAFLSLYATNSISNDFHVGNPFSNHGAGAGWNLLENSYGEMYQQDGYFGCAKFVTIFRNWIHTESQFNGAPRCIDIGRWGTHFNVVGNVLGSSTRANWHYIMTNANAADSLARIYNLGYPHPGNSFYRTNQVAGEDGSGMSWNYPGQQNRKGLLTNTVTIPTNRLAGTFTNVAIGQIILIQSSANTNYYYPLNTNNVRRTITAVGDGYVEINASTVTYTNDHTLYEIGDGSYYEGLQAVDIPTHLFHMNYDATNNALVADIRGITGDSNLPSSLFYSSIPPYNTNRTTGIALPWPINPTNGLAGVSRANSSARSLWEDEPMASEGDPDPSPTNSATAGGRSTFGGNSLWK